MKIACDIDEVIVDLMNPFLKFYNGKKGTSYKYEDIGSYNLWEVFGISRDEVIEVFDEFYLSPDFAELPLIKGAYQGVYDLSIRHDLSIITARPLYIKQKTTNYFNKIFSDIFLDISYISDFFEGNKGVSKSGFCLDNEIPIILEDNLEYAIDCAESGIKVVLFDRPWNKKSHNKDIFRVDNWKEALEVIGNEN